MHIRFELTAEQAKALIAFVDMGVKYGGVQVAEAGFTLAKVIDQAVVAAQKEEGVSDG